MGGFSGEISRKREEELGMKYFLTGGCGFIGAYTTRCLVNEGHEVVIYDLNPDTTLLFRLLKDEQRDKIPIIFGDTTDFPELIRTLKKHGVQKIIHLAGMLTAGSEANPSLAIRTNIQGTNNIFEAALLLGLNKVVWASSLAVFGTQDDYVEEFLAQDAVHKPRTLYGATKSFCEFLGRYYFVKHNLDNVGLRFSLVYGAGKYSTIGRGTGAAFASELIEKPVLSNEPCIVPFGDDVIDWLYVKDAARSIYLASLQDRTPERAYTICGDLRPMKEVVLFVKKMLPDARIELQPGKYEVPWKHDLKSAENGIKYRPEYSIEKGVEETIRMLRTGF